MKSIATNRKRKANTTGAHKVKHQWGPQSINNGDHKVNQQWDHGGHKVNHQGGPHSQSPRGSTKSFTNGGPHRRMKSIATNRKRKANHHEELAEVNKKIILFLWMTTSFVRK
uniref:Candidate secreted effector n=1 Tax=Meloidogyne incognita TaxID=6306 RepID=A0A914NQG2_MELIC